MLLLSSRIVISVAWKTWRHASIRGQSFHTNGTCKILLCRTSPRIKCLTLMWGYAQFFFPIAFNVKKWALTGSFKCYSSLLPWRKVAPFPHVHSVVVIAGHILGEQHGAVWGETEASYWVTRHRACIIQNNFTDVCVPTVVFPGDFDVVASLISRALFCVQVEGEVDRTTFHSYDFFRPLHKFKLWTCRQKIKPLPRKEYCSKKIVEESMSCLIWVT